MIGLDTNVLVRYVAQDDPKQSAEANRVIGALSPDDPGFVSVVSLVELVWVMQSCYSASKAEVVDVLTMLLRTRELVIENAETAIQAVHHYAGSTADFADCLIARSAHKAGCDHTVTFDRKAAETASMRLISNKA